MPRTRILIVDDHVIVREGLCALVAAEQDIEVVGQAENGGEALALALKTNPDVVLMDLSMPVSNGLEATRRLHKALPQTAVIVLSSYHDEESVAQLIQSGATGYLSKRSAAGILCEAIRSVRRGKPFYSPEIEKILRDKARMKNLPHGGALTPRELEVLQLIAEGSANKNIAAHLCISIKTVEKHRQAVMNKLNIHEAAGVTRYAISKGIIKCTPEKTEAVPTT